MNPSPGVGEAACDLPQRTLPKCCGLAECSTQAPWCFFDAAIRCTPAGVGSALQHLKLDRMHVPCKGATILHLTNMCVHG